MSAKREPQTRIGDVLIQNRKAAKSLYAVSIVLADGDLVGSGEQLVGGQDHAERLALSLLPSEGRIYMRSDDQWMEVPLPSLTEARAGMDGGMQWQKHAESPFARPLTENGVGPDVVNAEPGYVADGDRQGQSDAVSGMPPTARPCCDTCGGILRAAITKDDGLEGWQPVWRCTKCGADLPR